MKTDTTDTIKKSANGNIEKEIGLLETEIEKNSRNVDLYTRLSLLYRTRKQFQESADILQKALRTLNCA